MTTAVADQALCFLRVSSRDTLVQELEDCDRVPDGGNVYVDLANVEVIGSLQLAALIRFCLQMRDRDKRVVVTSVSSFVADVFHITKFDMLADVHV